MEDLATLGFKVGSAPVTKATDELDRFSRSARGAEQSAGRYTDGANRAATASERAAAKMNRASTEAAALDKWMRRAFSAYTIQQALSLVDASIKVENALKVAGLEGQALTETYDKLFASAQRNAAPLEALAQLYGRAALNQRELGASSEELVDFIDNVGKALRIQGTSAEASRGALIQLSQAIGSGIVRAEEFNSILEGALPIAQAAAAGLEEAAGSVAKLRRLVIDGKVSSEAFFRAFEAGSKVLDEKVGRAELTVSQGFVRLQNVLIDTAGKLDTATGASKTAAQALELVAQALVLISDQHGPVIQSLQDFEGNMDKLGKSASDLWNDPNWSNLVKFLIGDPELWKPSQIFGGRAKEIEDQANRIGAAVDQAFAGLHGDNGPADLQAQLEKLAAAFNETSVAAVSLSDYPVDAVDKKAAKLAEKIKTLTTVLGLQNEQMTALIEVYKGGAGSVADVSEKVIELQDHYDLLAEAEQKDIDLTTKQGEKWLEAAEKNAELKRNLEAVKSLYESSIGPMEKYGQTIAQLDKLYGASLITIGQYQMGMVRAKAAALNETLGFASEAIGLLQQIFGKTKALAIAEAIVNTAQGITKTLATYPWPFAGILAALHAAAGAVQIATIAKTNPGSGTTAPSVSGGASVPSIPAPTAPTVQAPTKAEPSAPRDRVVIHLEGADSGTIYTKAQVRDLIEQINEEVADGATIIVRRR